MFKIRRSYFHLLKKTMYKSRNKSILPKQTLIKEETIEILYALICVMMKFRIFVEKNAKVKEVIIYTFTNLNSKVFVKFVFVMKVRTRLLNVYQKLILFKIKYLNEMIYSVRNKDELKDFEQFLELQSKLEPARLEEKLGKHCFHCDMNELFAPITKTVADKIKEVIKETMSTTKEVESLNQETI